jgi:predicted DNA-binding protein (MmcQ/YjbR family)
MNLFEPESFERFVLTLAGVSLVEQWGAKVAKVGGKVFALVSLTPPDLHHLVFKTGETSFEVLTALEGIKQAPYFAKRQWVCVAPDAALSPDEIEAYLRRSHRLIASNLTKKLQRELGLPEP